MLKLQVIIYGVIILLFGSCQEQITHKNVLFILIDDLGYNDLSFRNNTFYETPHIDRIATEGFVFNEGYANAQVCSPSRASIMCGQFSARHGVTDWIGAPTGVDWRKKQRHNKLLPPEYVHGLAHDYTTLPEVLQSSGYKTFFAGKWHLGHEGSWPEDHGFDINVGGWDSGSPRGGYFSPFENPMLKDLMDGENLTMRLARETVKFLEDNKGEHFFAFLSFYAVHSPIQTTQEKWKKYRDKAKRNGVASFGYEMGRFLPIRQTQDNPIYGGLVESMDDAVGVVLDRLKDLGLDENTMVVFTSDNGGVASGDNYATSNLPLKGGKGYQYEGGIKVPLMIKIPWEEHHLRESNTPVTGADLYPTILEALDIDTKTDQHLDGKSLMGLMNGSPMPTRPLVWHYPHYGNQGGEPSSIIRQDQWKLIHYYEDERNELYNLDEDHGERNDLSDAEPIILKQLKSTLFKYLDEVGARYPIHDPEYVEAQEEEHLQNISTKKIKELEEQRLIYLSANFNPENDWWGSFQTID